MFFENAFNALFPCDCAGCRKADEGPLCPACSPSGVHFAPLVIPGVERVFTTASYESGVAAALKAAKYAPNRSLMVRLSRCFALAMGRTLRGGRLTAVVPVPSSMDRVWSRGFSPSALLARELAAKLRIPVVHALRARPGPRQAILSARRRTAVAARIRGVRNVDTHRILLVDDVVTTGSTAAACARELLGSGASEVWLATLCARRS